MSRKDVNEKRAVNLISHNYPHLPVNEQYRLIRYNIMFSSVDQEIKSIVVTSPEPADGKSTTAANLAIVLAQQGSDILLVDADLRKPSIHYSFNISNSVGLTSVLTKESNLDSALNKTHVPNLTILTSGPIPPNPTDLLNSKTMEVLMEDLKSTFDYVIYDTPPILAVTDPQVVANKSDGIILVVTSGKTHKDSALKAKELLDKANGQLLGVVLNGVEGNKNEYYYQYI